MSKPRNKIVLCSHTDCMKHECQNYSPRVIPDSFHFPDCLWNPRNLIDSNQTPPPAKMSG